MEVYGESVFWVTAGIFWYIAVSSHLAKLEVRLSGPTVPWS